MTNNDLRQKVIDAIVKAASGKIKKESNMNQEQLQVKANEFLSNYEALEQQEKLFSGALLKLAFQAKEIDINKIEKAIINDKKVSSDLAKAKFLLAFQFNDYLDMYRKKTQERVGLYVDEVYSTDNKEYELKSYEIPLIDLVKMSTDNTGKLNLTTPKLTPYNSNIVEDEISKDHVIEAKQAYNGVRNRVERYFERAGIVGNERKGGLLLQKIGRTQEGAKLASQGSLAEGYFKYLLDDHVTNLTKLCQQPKGNSPYYNHIFIKEFYEDYLSDVTSLSAIIEEDVKRNNGKDYAVKKGGADLPNLKQYKTVAEYIKTHDAPIDIEKELRNILQKETKINPALTKQEIAELNKQEIIKELKKDLTIEIKI